MQEVDPEAATLPAGQINGVIDASEHWWPLGQVEQEIDDVVLEYLPAAQAVGVAMELEGHLWPT